MINSIFASAVLLAAPALVAATGQAIVVNKCSYDVHLANTPASGGGYSEVDQTLSSGETYSQTYTQLSNGMGWSLKLCQDSSFGNILQYEYTYHDDGIIWFDLSEVNGNPWDGNWEITGSSGCTPKQSAYRFATDDAYGMQDCPDSATVTVTLCSGTSGGSSGGSSGSPSSPAESVAPAPTKTKKHHHHHHHHKAEPTTYGPPAGKMADESPSTMATSTTTEAPNMGGFTVTNYHTEYVTHYVTASPVAHKRHEHDAAHHA